MSYKQLKDNKWSYKLLKVPYLEGFHPPPEEEVRKPDLYIQQQSDDTVIPQPQLHQHQQQQQPLQQQYAESKPEVSSDVITTTESNAAGTTKPASTDSSSPAKETSGGGAKEDDVSRSYRLLPEVLMPPPPAPRNFQESWNRPRMVIKQQQHRQPKHQHQQHLGHQQQQHPGQQQQQHPGQEQLNAAQDVPKHLIPKQDYRSMQQHFAHKKHQNQQFVIKQEQQQSAHEQKPFASTSQQQGYGYGGGPNLGVGGPQDPRYSVSIQAPREVKMDGLGSMMQEANSSMKVSSTTGPESIEFDGNDCVLCRVCGDKASGFHYGVHSCEGCKGFFRRSIQQKIQYRPCSKNQQCSILRINRNRCQYCRLKKCIAAGMSRDAVRFGRVPKREKAKILAAMQSSKAKTIESKVVAEMSDERRLIDTVVRAHYDTCDYTADKIGPFIQAARNKQKLTQCTGQTCPMKGGPQQSFLDEFSDQLMDHVRQVCTFAKFIPGFKCLGKDDQVTLLKSCVFEVLTVRLSGLFDNQSLVCLNGDVIRRETISAMPAGNAKFLMDSVFELAQRINRFRLSDAEIGLFCSVVIISADRPGLMSPGLVSKMQDKLKTVLENILASRHPSPIFKDLTAILADLRVLNTLHTEKFLQQAKVTREEVQAAAASPHSVLGGSGYSGATSDTWEELNIADGDSTGSRSPKSSGSPATSHSFSLEDLQRSPMGGGGGSVSSSESLGGNSETFSKLSVNDLKIHGSVLLNALTSPALSAAAAHHRKRDISRLMGSGAGGGEPVTNTPRSQEEGPAGGAGESKCPFKARKLDSPSDSGIDSPKAQGSQSTNTSVCSSPRSSMEEGAGGGEDGPDSMEDQHPLLKRALQQPPQPFNMGGGGVTMFQDEVYKPHKKFRHNGRRDGDEPTSTQDGSCSPGPATSILATQLAAPPTYRRASPPPPTAGPPHQSLLATTLSRPVSVARAKRDEERSELLANLILDSGRWRPGHVSQSSSLLMCAPLPAHSPLPSAASPGGAASLRGAGHLPVPVAPTQPTSTLVSPRSSVSATTPHKSTSQLRTALMDASTGGAAQPLNLSVRTPPPADLTQPPEALKA